MEVQYKNTNILQETNTSYIYRKRQRGTNDFLYMSLYSTTVTYLASKAFEFGENVKRAITPFKIIRGHPGQYQSKARMQLTTYLVPLRSYRTLLFKFSTLCVFEPLFGRGA